MPRSVLKTVNEGMVQDILSRDFLIALIGPETDLHKHGSLEKTVFQADRSVANEVE